MGIYLHSNTTLVKVKYRKRFKKYIKKIIQIQLLLKLNSLPVRSWSWEYFNSNTTLVKVKYSVMVF